MTASPQQLAFADEDARLLLPLRPGSRRILDQLRRARIAQRGRGDTRRARLHYYLGALPVPTPAGVAPASASAEQSSQPRSACGNTATELASSLTAYTIRRRPLKVAWHAFPTVSVDEEMVPSATEAIIRIKVADSHYSTAARTRRMHMTDRTTRRHHLTVASTDTAAIVRVRHRTHTTRQARAPIPTPRKKNARRRGQRCPRARPKGDRNRRSIAGSGQQSPFASS